MRLTIYICGTVLVGLLAPLTSSSSQALAKSTAQVNEAQHSKAERSGWQKLDAGAFSISAPPGWSFHQLKGVDSYVGEFTGDGVVLRFDFGGYSNRFKEEKKSAYVVVHKSIGGLPAQIVSPKTPGHGVIGIYFPRTFGSNKLSLFGQDLTITQQELVMEIFDTIRFGSAVPPVLPPPPAQEISDPFAELNQLTTTDRAAKRIARAADQDPELRQQAVEKVPGMIDRAEINEVWLNAVRLAGQLKIIEALPSLQRAFSRGQLGVPLNTTFGTQMELKDDVVAKALAEIGDPSLPAVTGFLKSSDPKTRRRAVLILMNIDSPASRSLLEDHVPNEPDSRLSGLIKQWEANRKQ